MPQSVVDFDNSIAGTGILYRLIFHHGQFQGLHMNVMVNWGFRMNVVSVVSMEMYPALHLFSTGSLG